MVAESTRAQALPWGPGVQPWLCCLLSSLAWILLVIWAKVSNFLSNLWATQQCCVHFLFGLSTVQTHNHQATPKHPEGILLRKYQGCPQSTHQAFWYLLKTLISVHFCHSQSWVLAFREDLFFPHLKTPLLSVTLNFFAGLLVRLPISRGMTVKVLGYLIHGWW